MAEFIDHMNMGDKPVEVSLQCAKCKAVVKSGKGHICGYQPNSSASTGAEMYIPVRSKKDETKS